MEEHNTPVSPVELKESEAPKVELTSNEILNKEPPQPLAESLPAEESRKKRITIKENTDGQEGEDSTPEGKKGNYKSAFTKERLSTPERIRQKTAKLYEEVHNLIDKHETRNTRQREISRHDSDYYGRKESIANIGNGLRSRSRGSRSGSRQHSRSASKGAVGGSMDGGSKNSSPAIDLQKTFEESRRQHLLEAQAQRSQFPPMNKTYTDSSKDPGAFSLRFTDGDVKRLN